GSHPSRPPARRQTGRRPPRPSRTDESEERAHGGSPGIRVEAPRQTTHGLTSTTADTTSATDPKILRHFTRRGRAPTPRRTTPKIGPPPQQCPPTRGHSSDGPSGTEGASEVLGA